MKSLDGQLKVKCKSFACHDSNFTRWATVLAVSVITRSLVATATLTIKIFYFLLF